MARNLMINQGQSFSDVVTAPVGADLVGAEPTGLVVEWPGGRTIVEFSTVLDPEARTVTFTLTPEQTADVKRPAYYSYELVCSNGSFLLDEGKTGLKVDRNTQPAPSTPLEFGLLNRILEEVQTGMDGEVGDREAADLILQGHIDQEVTSRINAMTAHAGLTLTVHGIPDTSKLVSVGNDNKIPPNLLPALAIGIPFVVSSEASMLLLDAQRGDVAKRTDIDGGAPYMLSADDPTVLGNWVRLTGDYALASDLTNEYARALLAEQKATITKWAANTSYLAGQLVVAPNTDLVIATAAFTSGATYNPLNWTRLKTSQGLDPRDFGAYGDGSNYDDVGMDAAFAAAQAIAAYSGGRLPPILLSSGAWRRTTSIQMYHYMVMRSAVGREIYGNNCSLENHFTNMFSWPSGLTQIKGLVLEGIFFMGQPTLAPATGAFTPVTYTDAVTNGTTTLSLPTGATLTTADVGRVLTGTNIATGARIASVTNPQTVIMDVAATGSGSGLTVNVTANRSGGPYTLYPFDPSVYGTKQLYYPKIRDCVFEYFHQLKVNLLGGEISGGQMLHFDSTALYIQGYDYSLGGGSSPLYMGMDSSASTSTPMIYLENGSNVKLGDLFPTVVTGGRGLHIKNVEGVISVGSRIDGYDTAAPNSYPMGGAAIYLDGVTSSSFIAPRIHGSMGGPAKDGVSPTDYGSVHFKNCKAINLIGAQYIHTPVGAGTHSYEGTNSNIRIVGSVYNASNFGGYTANSGVKVLAPGATVSDLFWDEDSSSYPPGPSPLDIINATAYSAGTTYGTGYPLPVVYTALGTYASVASNNTGNNPDTDNGSHWKKIALNGTNSTNYYNTFGDGSDGAVVLDGTSTVSGFTRSGTTYTQTQDIHSTAFTLNAGVTLKPVGYALFCTGTVTTAATSIVDLAGTPGAANGTAGAGGAGATYGAGGGGGAGNTGVGTVGNGGAMGGGAGGSGGTSGASGGSNAGGGNGAVTTTAALVLRLRIPMAALVSAVINNGTTRAIGGGAGGGGGGGDGTNKGGGGGGGGGVWVVFAHAMVHNGAINANGGAGGTPTTGNAGGGGPGGGGAVLLYLLAALTGSGTITVAAGAQGVGVGSGATALAAAAGTSVQKVLV